MMHVRKILVPLAALGLAAGGITAGATALSTVASPAPSVQQSSETSTVAWLPQPHKTCRWIQVGPQRQYVCW